MTTSMFITTPRQKLSQYWLASPPAIWGKLPSHGDYVRHGASPAEARDWLKWITQTWYHRAAPMRAKHSQGKRHGQPDWLALDAPKGQADLRDVPVAFVLQPGSLPFAPTHFVQGVCIESQDSVGRNCPLIIYQRVSPRWIERTWGHKPPSATSGASSAARALTSPALPDAQHLLYWLARIAARTHAADLSPAALAELVHTAWQAFEPGWGQLLGAAPAAAELSALRACFSQHRLDDVHLDSAHGLHGVSRLPWANWPQRLLRRERPLSAFWQQDADGGYVNASDELFTLWRHPA